MKSAAATATMPREHEQVPSLPILLLRSRVVVARRFNHALRRHGLTEQQWRILRSLSLDDFAEVTELAERVDLLPSSLSRILRDLSERGLVVRTTARDDGRRTLSIITPQARVLVAETMVDVELIYTEIDDSYGRDNVLELRLRLASLIDALAATDAANSAA